MVREIIKKLECSWAQWLLGSASSRLVLCSLLPLSALFTPCEGVQFSYFVLILASPIASWLPLCHARPLVASVSQILSLRCPLLSPHNVAVADRTP